MSASSVKRPKPPAEGPFEEAVRALLNEWQANGKCSQSDKALILALARKISLDRRTALLQGVEQELSTPNPRGGPVYSNVIRLIDERPDWTAARLRRRLSEVGQPVDTKSLSNCLNYLVKSGRLTRISRGHYAVAGFGVVTSDVLPAYDIEKGGENED